MKIRRTVKVLLYFILALLGLLILLFIAFNLPASHRFLTGEVNRILHSAGLPVKIGSVHRVTPRSVIVRDVKIEGRDGAAIITAGYLRSEYKLLALMKKKVIVPGLNLENTDIKLVRNNVAEGLNIARAFTSGRETGSEPDTAQTEKWLISVGRADITNIRFSYIDSVSQLFIRTEAGRIRLKSDRMSILEQVLILESLETENLTGNIEMSPAADEKNDPGDAQWQFGLRDFSATNLNFVFDNKSGRMKLDLICGEMGFSGNRSDFAAKNLEFDRISVSGTTIVLSTSPETDDAGTDQHKIKGPETSLGHETNIDQANANGNVPLRDMGQAKVTGTAQSGDAEALLPWNISGNGITLRNVSFRNEPYKSGDSLSTAALGILDLSAQAQDIRLNGTEAGATLKSVTFGLGNGLIVKELEAKILSDENSTSLGFLALTANSRIDIKASAAGNLRNIIASPLTNESASLGFKNSIISYSDIAPFLGNTESLPLDAFLAAKQISLSGSIELKDKTLQTQNLSISSTSGLEVALKGSISNPQNPEMAVLDIGVSTGSIRHELLAALFATLSEGFELPDIGDLRLEASFSDSLVSPSAILKLTCPAGDIAISGTADRRLDTFSGEALISRLYPGRILGNKLFGEFSGSLQFSGSGIMKKKLHAKALLNADSLEFNDHTYTNSQLEFSISPGTMEASLRSQDSDLRLGLEARAGFSGKSLDISASGSLRANLHALGFMKDSLTAALHFKGSASKNVSSIEAQTDLTGISIIVPADSALIDRLSLSLSSDSGGMKAAAGNGFIKAEAQSSLQLSELSELIKAWKDHFAAIISAGRADTAAALAALPLLNAEIDISGNKLIPLLLRDTSAYFKNISVSLRTGSDRRSIDASLSGKDLKFGGLSLAALQASLSDSSRILDLRLKGSRIAIGPQKFSSISVASHFSDWKSNTLMSALDEQANEKYRINIVTESRDSIITVNSPAGKIILNSTEWILDEPHILTADLKSGTFSPSVRMHAGESSIGLSDTSDDDWRALVLTLKDVSVSSLIDARALPGNPGFTVTGTAGLKTNSDKEMRVNTVLNLRNISWSDLMYEHLDIDGSYYSGTNGEKDLQISGRIDSAAIKIRINEQAGKARTASAEFSSIPVNTLQPMLQKYTTDLGGYVSGKLTVSGNDDDSKLTGEIKIDDGNFRIVALNSAYRVPSERIVFSGKKILLDKFSLIDSLNHRLSVDGEIDFSEKEAATAKLEIEASDLQVMNRTDDGKSPLYGRINIDSRLGISGLLASPLLKGRIKLSRGTEIWFRQQQDMSMSESGELVTFVSSAAEGKMPGNAETGLGIKSKASIESLVGIDPETRLNISIARKMFNIDVSIEGGGELIYNMMSNSQVNLSGRYEVNMGAANLKMIGWPNKAFTITKGGFIRWDGKAEDPEIHFEAINRVRSSYTNPVDGKERYVDFDVILSISNRLSAMDVLFTISTPDQYLMSIINTLSPDEQMRQAITILLFENIDLPGISSTSSYITEQVNQMVASQLNQLTKTTIKGVDISFGIDTYTKATGSGGQTTETSLSYELKRSMLNNRGQIEVSGRLNDLTNQPAASNLSLNNLSFEYRLDSAATKFLKVYNERTYEDVFEGEVIKTGIGITYRKNYSTLRDIWKRDDSEEETNKKKK